MAGSLGGADRDKAEHSGLSEMEGARRGGKLVS